MSDLQAAARPGGRGARSTPTLQRDFSLQPDPLPVPARTLCPGWTRGAGPTRWTCSRWWSRSSRTRTSSSTSSSTRSKGRDGGGAEGAGRVEYAERMEELDKLEHPEAAARTSSTGRSTPSPPSTPGSGHENIRPKSVARDMPGAVRHLQRLRAGVRAAAERGASAPLPLRRVQDAGPDRPRVLPRRVRWRKRCRACGRTVRESRLQPGRRVGAAAASRKPPSPRAAAARGPQGPTHEGHSPRRIRSELHRLLKAVADRAWDARLACLAPGPGLDSGVTEARGGAPISLRTSASSSHLSARRPSMAVVRPTGPVAGRLARKILAPTARRTGCSTVARRLALTPTPRPLPDAFPPLAHPSASGSTGGSRHATRCQTHLSRICLRRPPWILEVSAAWALCGVPRRQPRFPAAPHHLRSCRSASHPGSPRPTAKTPLRATSTSPSPSGRRYGLTGPNGGREDHS